MSSPRSIRERMGGSSPPGRAHSFKPRSLEVVPANMERFLTQEAAAREPHALRSMGPLLQARAPLCSPDGVTASLRKVC